MPRVSCAFPNQVSFKFVPEGSNKNDGMIEKEYNINTSASSSSGSLLREKYFANSSLSMLSITSFAARII